MSSHDMTVHSDARKHLCFVVGTRPEAIKLAPLIKKAQADTAQWLVTVCSTGQHDELLRQVLDLFHIVPRFRLEVMRPGQSLSELTVRLLEAIAPVLAAIRPHVVIVQGDTTSALCGAVSAFYEKIPVAHVEAGLRTNDPYAPFPEEINRRLVAQLTTWHFAPTEQARKNLLAENVPPEHIYVVGNTVIDAVREIAQCTAYEADAQLRRFSVRPFVLMTHHRRESFGPPIERVFRAIRTLALQHPEVDFVFPLHPNPNVRQHADAMLAGIANVVLLEPLPYHHFVFLMTRALFLITDSGGIQEEATALGKRVLVTRETTERPEAVEAGNATLVGTDEEKLVTAAEALLASPRPMGLGQSNEYSPFGDGRASERILRTLSLVLSK